MTAKRQIKLAVYVTSTGDIRHVYKMLVKKQAMKKETAWKIWA
jgi:hypothetical protein